jgi:hypothetical protein
MYHLIDLLTFYLNKLIYFEFINPKVHSIIISNEHSIYFFIRNHVPYLRTEESPNLICNKHLNK